MSRRKISELESATDITGSDLIQVVDVEDSEMAVSGTNKKATASLLANQLVPLINSNSIDGGKIANESITSEKIQNGTIVNSDINSSAAISGTKISPVFGSQNVSTTGDLLAGAIGIGTSSIDNSCILDISSTTRGFKPPSMTEAQRNLIASPVSGVTVYNNTTQKLNFYNGTEWMEAVKPSDWLFQGDYGIVSDNSSDTVATNNATAIATAFAESSLTGKPLVLVGKIYVKGQVLLAGSFGTIYGHQAEIIQKDTTHNGITLSEVAAPYGLRIFGLKITGQGSTTHNAAGIYARKNNLSYLTSDIILRDCTIQYFRTGISIANVAKFQTDNVTIAYVRTGMDWDSMQTVLCTMTRIVSGDSNPESVCWKTRGSNFATRIIGGEYGGSGFARFAELSDGAQMHFEACNLEAFSSPQTINISAGGIISIVDSRIACVHSSTGAVISAAVTGATSGLPTIVWRNNQYVSSGRRIEIHGSSVARAPRVFGDQILITFAATQGGVATQTINSVNGQIIGLNADLPTSGTIGAGAMFVAIPSDATSSYNSDAGATNPLIRYFDNRTGTTKLGSMSNDMLMQVWATANTEVQNSLATETDLFSVTIPARYSNTGGDTNHMVAYGTTASNSNSKTFKVYLAGSVVIDFGAIAANNESWKLDITIHRGGGVLQQKIVAVLQGGASIGTIVKTAQTSPTATTSMIFKITGTGTATGDITMAAGKSWWVRSQTVLGS